jgi:hypothetical protein
VTIFNLTNQIVSQINKKSSVCGINIAPLFLIFTPDGSEVIHVSASFARKEPPIPTG